MLLMISRGYHLPGLRLTINLFFYALNFNYTGLRISIFWDLPYFAGMVMCFYNHFLFIAIGKLRFESLTVTLVS